MEFHYTWQFGRHFAPLLRFLRESGFFEAPVYMTVMIVPAIALFIMVFKKLDRNDSLRTKSRVLRFLWYFFYLFMCWLAMASLAVIFKTMIVEELDYQERQWFEAYLPALHFYIMSGCLAYIALVVRSRLHFYDLLLVVYLQVALIAGYWAASYRTLNEDFGGAIGGVALLIIFGICNYDLIARVRRGFSVGDPVADKSVA